MFAARYDPTGSNSLSKEEKKQQLLNKLKNKKKNQQSDESVERDLKKDNDGDIEMNDAEDTINDEQTTNPKRKREELGSDSEEESSDESSDSSSEDEEDDDDSDNEIAANESTQTEDVDVKNAHKSILSRFQKVMKKQDNLPEEVESVNEEPVEVKDVAPLPQLRLPRDKQLYSQIHKNQNLDWLTKPAYYDSTSTKPFVEFNPKVKDTILNNLTKEFNIETAFSVQITLIQELLKDLKRGKLDPTPRGDYLINAATGSGKTLSYLVPIVQHILDNSVKNNQVKIKDLGIKAVIILPTKPLVQQVYSDTLKLTKGTDINVMALKSGGDVSIIEESKKLKSNLVDILITTPGRLVEHLDSIQLQMLRFLVVDEADRLLNQNFQDWCDLLMNKIEHVDDEDSDLDKFFRLRCIKLVLSATLTTNSEKLTHLRLFKPRLVIVNSDNQHELYQLPKLLDEKVIRITEKLSYYKPLILLRFFEWVDKVNNRYNNFGIIFTKSNESTIRLNKLLTELNTKFGLKNKIGCINSIMNNQERNKILKTFDEEGGILICTDLLSRGINLTSIKFVINYDLPTSTKEYVHRIGRTARAGNAGNAVTLCYGEGEFKWFKKVVYSGQQINRNGKQVTDIKFVKDKNEVEEEILNNEWNDVFELNISEDDKDVYEKCLKDL